MIWIWHQLFCIVQGWEAGCETKRVLTFQNIPTPSPPVLFLILRMLFPPPSHEDKKLFLPCERRGCKLWILAAMTGDEAWFVLFAKQMKWCTPLGRWDFGMPNSAEENERIFGKRLEMTFAVVKKENDTYVSMVWTIPNVCCKWKEIISNTMTWHEWHILESACLYFFAILYYKIIPENIK